MKVRIGICLAFLLFLAGCAAHVGSKKVYLISLGPAVLVVADREVDTEAGQDKDESCDTATSDQH